MFIGLRLDWLGTEQLSAPRIGVSKSLVCLLEVPEVVSGRYQNIAKNDAIWNPRNMTANTGVLEDAAFIFVMCRAVFSEKNRGMRKILIYE